MGIKKVKVEIYNIMNKLGKMTKMIDFHRCIQFRIKVPKRMANWLAGTKIQIEKRIKEMDIKTKDLWLYKSLESQRKS